MAKDTTYPELRIEPELMEKLRDIVKRREEVQALVDKAESNKTKVKPAIYSKVITDYRSRLKAIRSEFVPVSEQVKKGLEDVQRRETDIRARLQEVSDDLEEQRFRCQIGEFPKKELEPIEAEMGEVQRELNEQIGVLESTYEECSRCLSEPPPESAHTLSGESCTDAPAVAELPRVPTPPPAPLDAGGSKEPFPPGKDNAPRPRAAETRPKLEPVAGSGGEPTPEPGAEPAATQALKLVNKDGDPELHPLTADKLSIGRSPKSDIVLKVAGVSRTHAHVVRTGDERFTIIDTSGGGGVAVNGKKQKKAALEPGDTIRIASVEIEVVTA